MNVGLLLFDGFSNHCVANVIEPLRAANMLGVGRKYRWQYLTLSGTAATSSSGLRILPDDALANCGGDLLLVAPSYGFQQYLGSSCMRALRAAAKRFDFVAGLDTGAWLLAAAGLLDDHRATIHPEEFIAFAEAFPKVEATRARFIVDRNRITCSGAMSAFDLSLHLIKEAWGVQLRLEVEKLFVVDAESGTGGQTVQVQNRLLRRALVLMNENLEHPLKISEIARQLGCSQKQLEETVKRETDQTPQSLYCRQRLIESRRLVNATDMPMSEIGLRCGYRNASAMSRASRLQFGESASAMRKKAGR